MPGTYFVFDNLLNEWLTESWETFQAQAEEQSTKFPKKRGKQKMDKIQEPREGGAKEAEIG